MRRVGHAQIATCPADVLDIELLAKPFGQLLRDEARGDIGHTTGRERHDYLDRTIRIACRMQVGRGRDRQHRRNGNSHKQIFEHAFPLAKAARLRLSRGYDYQIVIVGSKSVLL